MNAMEKEVSYEKKQNGTHSLCDAGIGNVARFGMLTYARRVRDRQAYPPPQKGSETRKPTPTPKKFTFSEVLKRAVTTKQVPDDAVVSGDTSKLWRIIFDGLGAKAGDALAFVYVSPSGDDSNEGSSWAKAKKKIGGALNGITDATDTKRYIVLIGAGAYSPSASLSLKNYVALIGGFEALNNEETRYERRGTTTISGEDNTIRVFKNENLDTLSTPSKKSTAVLAGVTITKGTREKGGGMYNSNSSPTVVHTTFSGNTATGTNGRGGGMYNHSSSPTVVHTTFSGNKATGSHGSGGGMYNHSSSPTVVHTTFSGNKATGSHGSGGGMYNHSSSPMVSHTTFSGNEANVGGGMVNDNSSPTVVHTTFSQNEANVSGGMYNHSNSSPMVSHTTFSGNKATGTSTNTNGHGGGMYNHRSSPMVSHTTFSGNTAKDVGGGMVNWDGSSPTVSYTTFSGNTAGSGGGMYNVSSSPTVVHTTFSGNTATVDGGGMYNVFSSSPTVVHTTFSGNTATSNGGGMVNDNSSPTVVHTTFSGNTAGSGGGMHNGSSSPTVSHTTFSGNTATSNGGGMYNRGIPNENGSSPVISSSIFWGNTKGATHTRDQIDNDSKSIPVVAHSIVQGGYPGGTSIIDENPRLGPLTENGGVVKTMALKAGSRAINNGLYFARKGTTNYYSKDDKNWYKDPTLTKNKTTSLLDAVRYDTDARGYGYNGHPDIGAYEYGGTAP